MTEKRNKDRNVPTLRFPGFSEDWNSSALGELMDFKVTNSLSREKLNYVEGNVKNIHYGDIHTKFQTLFDIRKENVPFINKDVDLNKIHEDCYCKEGDIVFADASEDLNDIGKSIEIIKTGNQKLLAGLHTLLGRPNSNVFYPGFAGYLFLSKSVRTQIQREAQGAKVLGISIGRISKVELKYPALREQEKISKLLSIIDSRIQTQNKIIEELKLLKSTLCTQLVEAHKGLQYKVSEIANIGRGRVISSREIGNQRNPLYPVYSSQTTNDGIMGYLDEFDFDGEHITWTTDGANAGTVFHRNGKFNCTNVCGVLKIKDTSKVNPCFVALALQRQTKKYVSTNLANPKLMNNVMAGITIELPQIEIQNRISRLNNGIGSKIINEMNYLDYLLKQKKYFLDQLFK